MDSNLQIKSYNALKKNFQLLPTTYLRSLFYGGQVYYHDNFVMILKFIKTKITVLTEVATSVKTIEAPNKQNQGYSKVKSKKWLYWVEQSQVEPDCHQTLFRSGADTH